MQQQLENILAQLIATPSESTNAGACRKIIEYVRTELKPLGLHITTEHEAENPWLMATTLLGYTKAMGTA